jgi:aconitate hydratase
MARLMTAGATIRTAFCGPCFGAGDVPANGGLSVRHTTRNFPSREGSKPQSGQIASVALMDARSVAATAANGGVLTAATSIDKDFAKPKYLFDSSIYQNRCYDGRGKAEPDTELVYGPGSMDWPKMEPLAEDLLLKVVSLITDPVTTTDELIPSGETSSYRSNPLALAEFALSRKDPEYVPNAKAVQALEKARLAGNDPTALDSGIKAACDAVAAKFPGRDPAGIGIGSVVYAKKPGDGSAREQAASCQKVLGTFANIAEEYATKRYRSNLINWGMLPFLTEGIPFQRGDWLYIPGIRAAVLEKRDSIPAYAFTGSEPKEFTLTLSGLTDDEREIILEGCLINYYKSGK